MGARLRRGLALAVLCTAAACSSSGTARTSGGATTSSSAVAVIPSTAGPSTAAATTSTISVTSTTRVPKVDRAWHPPSVPYTFGDPGPAPPLPPATDSPAVAFLKLSVYFDWLLSYNPDPELVANIVQPGSTSYRQVLKQITDLKVKGHRSFDIASHYVVTKVDATQLVVWASNTLSETRYIDRIGHVYFAVVTPKGTKALTVLVKLSGYWFFAVIAPDRNLPVIRERR